LTSNDVKFKTFLTVDVPVVMATFKNQVGIVGAALAAAEAP